MIKHKPADLIIIANSYLETITKNPAKLPSITEYRQLADIGADKLLDLRATNTELNEILNKVEDAQELYLLARGDQTKNPTFQIFLLKTKHKYNDANPNLTQNNYLNVSPDILSAALKLK